VAIERRRFGDVVHREEEREIPQREEHGWTMKGTHGSSRRRIRESARLSTEWGGGAGGSARAARRPFRTPARRGERRDGQHKHRGRWKEEELNTWSGAQKVQSGGRGGELNTWIYYEDSMFLRIVYVCPVESSWISNCT
jgi:hypothetical protein